MFSSHEVRWFLEGSIEQYPDVRKWIENGTHRPAWIGRLGGRPDAYIVVPGSSNMGIKWREDQLQIKGLESALPIGNPQVWNRYAYTMNNPLKYVDPNGECSKPAKKALNDAGICIEAFIESKTIGVIGRGDGRSFSGTDSSLTARSRLQLVISPDGKIKSKDVETARSGLVIKGFGLRGNTVAEVVQNTLNDDGSRTIGVVFTGANGEYGVPFAPKGVFVGTFSFTISKGGAVSLNAERSSATGFPSWGIYGYDANQAQPKALREIRETNVEALQQAPIPLPKIKP